MWAWILCGIAIRMISCLDAILEVDKSMIILQNVEPCRRGDRKVVGVKLWS